MKHTTAVALAVLLFQSAVPVQAVELVLARVKQERAPFIDTVRELVSIESGSRDIDTSGESVERPDADVLVEHGALRVMGLKRNRAGTVILRPGPSLPPFQSAGC
jgi:hypothetical protein